MNSPVDPKEKMVPIETVVLTEEEQQECQAMLRSLTKVEGGYYLNPA